MQKINFQNLPSTTTPLNATNLNAIQTNVENVFNGDVPMGNIKVDGLKSKNMAGVWLVGGISAETGEDSDTASSRRTDYIPVDFTNVSNYRLSGMPGTNGRIFVNAYNSSKQSLGRTSAYIESSTTAISISSSSFTGGTPQGTGAIKYIRIHIYNAIAGVNINNLTKNVQLEEGDTTTTFSEYKGYGYVSGSNANGSYIRYDDGTLICWNRIEVASLPITSAYGSLYISSNLTSFGNFPVNFSGVPTIHIGTESDDELKFWWVIKSNRPSQSEIRGFRAVSANNLTLTNARFNYIAIGRWK